MRDGITIDENSVFLNNTKIKFFNRRKNDEESYLVADEMTIAKTDCGWKFTIPAVDSEILGLMIPVGSFEVFINNDALNLYKSRKYYYAPGQESERLLGLNPRDLNKLDTPMVHMIDKDQTYSWSCPGECVISSFIYQYDWCINFETVANENKVTFFLDQSTNALVNLQRHPPQDKELLINPSTSLQTMKEALLTGAKPRRHPNYPHDLIRKTRQVQLELNEHDVKSVIIGSLARRLNYVPVDVDDIDLMAYSTKELDVAIDVLDSFADRISCSNSHAKFQYQNSTIDICYDNYNILPCTDHVINKQGLSYLGVEGLLWLYMTNLFECEMEEHSENYRSHVNNAISSLYKAGQFKEFDLIPYKSSMPDYSDNCFKFCQQLSEAQMEYRDIRINKPFVIRPFKKGNIFFYVIINHGSICDAEIIIDQIPTTAVWEDISGLKKPVEINPEDNFSVLHVSQIYLPGILQCQIEEK